LTGYKAVKGKAGQKAVFRVCTAYPQENTGCFSAASLPRWENLPKSKWKKQ
jgi:hypothetical protein